MYESMAQAVHGEGNPFFRVARKGGEYSCGNPMSYYAKDLGGEFLLYDAANNRALANLDVRGGIRELVFYHSCYIYDDAAGKWVAKHFTREEGIGFSLELDGKLEALSELDCDFETDLLDNLFPRVRYDLDGLGATLLAFAPISEDGKTRVPGVVYALMLENRSDRTREGRVVLPGVVCEDPGLPERLYARRHVIIRRIEPGYERDGDVAFCLRPGESAWVPLLLSQPGEDAGAVFEQGALHWLNQTQAYYRSILGRLTMPNDPLTASILERSILQCQGALAMDAQGEVIGANWGTYPATVPVWHKDMFHALTPLTMLDPELTKKAVRWFLRYGIRERDNRYEGGVTHSLTNALASVILAGMVYESTADADLFRADGDRVFNQIRHVLEQVVASRDNEDVWLFPSIWISDALSLGKYHTGSNICAWKAFSSMARVAEGVYGDRALAGRYRDIAANIRSDIERYMTFEGKYGRQYLEGIGGLTPETQKSMRMSDYKTIYELDAAKYMPDYLEDGVVNLVMHDGEESDTTMIPVYGYADYDDPVLRNYLRFTFSPENPTYGEQCRAIRWGDESGATFPGYSTAFAAIVDAESMNGERGYMTEMKRLVDLDGSWWWWPYLCGAPTGEVVRNNRCGKCGWASGVFACLMITQMLGAGYDAPSRTLRLRPFSPCSGFTWEDARLGGGRFSLAFESGGESSSVRVENLCEHAVTVDIELVSDGHPSLNGGEVPHEKGVFLGKNTVRVKATVGRRQQITLYVG